jgi:hypothetical protein
MTWKLINNDYKNISKLMNYYVTDVILKIFVPSGQTHFVF